MKHRKKTCFHNREPQKIRKTKNEIAKEKEALSNPFNRNLDTTNICDNIDCELSHGTNAMMHRHSTKQCKDHQFCAPSTWPWQEDVKHTQPFESVYSVTKW